MTKELYHHGIKGQKWGVRRTPAQLGRVFKRRSSGSQISEDYKKAHDSKSIKRMSDAELRARINRLNLEKQYSQMSSTRIDRGRELLKTAVVITGSVIALKKNRDTIVGWFGKK